MATTDRRKYRNPVQDVQDMIANMANEYAGISPGGAYDTYNIDKNVYAMPRGAALPPDVEVIKGGSKWMPTISREREFFPERGQPYPADVTPFSRRSPVEQTSFEKYMKTFTDPLSAAYAHIAGAQAQAAPHVIYSNLMKEAFKAIQEEKKKADEADKAESSPPARPPAPAVSPEERGRVPAIPGIPTAVPDYLNPNKVNPWLQYEPYAPKKEKKRKKVFGE